MPAEIATWHDGGEPVWIFAYGSLLWDAALRAVTAEPALLRGYHRSFCLYSYDYRGTPAQPGLTLGLDRGGSCRGIVLRLPADMLDRVWQREMSGRLVYDARVLRVMTANDTRRALAFTALRSSADYAGKLSLDEAARLILGAAGRRGTCRDYFENTVRHLEQLGLADRPLRRLAKRVRALPRTMEFETLIAERKGCRICIERSPGKIRSCAEFPFDSDVVSLWEQWLGHRNPKLLVVGQDFGNVDYFIRNRGRDEPFNKTNVNLHQLLTAAGIDVKHPSQCDVEAPVFLTNSILCIKEGPMTGPILSSWVDACAERHLRPLIGLLSPPVVVGMGGAGWRAVRRVFGLDAAPRLISRAAGSCWIAEDTHVFAVGHCGPLGIINRSWPQQLADWQRIGAAVSVVSGMVAG